MRDFAPSADERDAIGEICRLLQGMPLGIELAASWVDEVLRQFARAKLEASSLACEETLDRHSSYYAAFLGGSEADLKGASPRDALERIDDELDNVRVAWARMVERSQLANISASLTSLNLYYSRRGPLDESEAAFARAAARLGHEGRLEDPLQIATLAELLTVRAGHLRQQGRYAEAVALLDQVLSSVPGDKHAKTRAYALVEQGTALLWAGDPARGIATTELGVTLFRGLDDAWGLAHSLDRLGSVARRVARSVRRVSGGSPQSLCGE